MKIISLQKQRTKGLNDEVFSISNRYIHTYIHTQTQSVYHVITQYYNGTSTLHGERF